MVDYNNDIIGKYELLFQAAYEKANIWPITGVGDGVDILGEEIGEALAAVEALNAYWADILDRGSGLKPVFPTAFETEEVRAHAFSAIFELLQVVAVCNKYYRLFANEEEWGSYNAD